MYEQPDLWQATLAREHVDPPPPDGRPRWRGATLAEQRENCAHCTLCVAAARKRKAGEPRPVPRVRKTDVVRIGATGSITLLCAEHEALQRRVDKIRYPGG